MKSISYGLLAVTLALLSFSCFAFDRSPPTVPSSVTASPVSTSQINLKWSASRDNVRVSKYRVYRGNTLLASPTSTSFSDSGLKPATAYSYQVQAVDPSGNASSKSQAVLSTTLSDTTPPPVSTAEVGYIGCSMTMAAANGALNLGMSNLWNTKPEYGGGGVWQWASKSAKYWDAFQAAYNAQPVSVIWWELCAVESTKADETYENALLILDELKRRIPGVTVYVSAQPAYNPSSHECAIAGVGGQSRMASIAAQLVSAGEAITGPTQGPLEYPSQVKSDGCHPVASGEQVLGKQLLDFFLTKTPPPPTASAGIASGIYVVDTEPNVATALASPYTDGLLVRARWEQVEPTEGAVNTKAICDKLTQAHKLNKGVSFVFYPLPPKWLLAKVSTSEQWSLPLGKATTTINPWNTTLLDAMSKTATAIGNSICEGVPLRAHPALKQVDTTIAGALSVRDKPASATQAQMSSAVMSSVKIWRSAFYTENDTKSYYMSIFPYRDKAVDAAAIAKEVLSAYPYQHFMTENWGVAGVGDTSILKLAKYKIFQACGYFSNSKIKCSDTGRADNTPQNAFDKILKPLGGVMSLQIYADDIVNPAYSEDIKYIHEQVNQ